MSSNAPIPVANHPDQQGTLLQTCVASTIDLALTLKQLHWNIRGPHFKPVHEFLDEIIDHARATTDTLAERMVTLGLPAIGQRASLPASSVPIIENGFLKDTDVIHKACDALAQTIKTLRSAQEQLADLDAVTEDLVIASQHDLEKDLWMMKSHIL